MKTVHLKIVSGLTIISLLLALVFASLKSSYIDEETVIQTAKNRINTGKEVKIEIAHKNIAKSNTKASNLKAEPKTLQNEKETNPTLANKNAETSAKQVVNIVSDKASDEVVTGTQAIVPGENISIIGSDYGTGNNANYMLPTNSPTASPIAINGVNGATDNTQAAGIETTTADLYATSTYPQAGKQAANGGPPPEEGGPIIDSGGGGNPLGSLPIGNGVFTLLLLAASYVGIKRRIL